MPFTFTKCPIDGLFEISPKVFGDNRGYFFESYTEKDFFEAGLTMKFVQDNQSLSKKGVLRGLHFQEKFPQGKLVRAISGKTQKLLENIILYCSTQKSRISFIFPKVLPTVFT